VTARRTSPGQSRASALLDWLVQPPIPWQMKFGDRCALEGLLSFLKPGLSIEIGTAEGGSLHRLAEHSREIHSFDIVPGVADLKERFSNVEFHIGDSATLLPELLTSLADAGRNVDFALVDGDHSAEGVQRDARALLDSEACRETVIVFHDAANDHVRAGLDALELAGHPKVALSLLDFVPGYVVENGPRRFEIWNGLALVVLDDRRGVYGAFVDSEVYAAAAVNRLARDHLRGEVAENGQPVEAASESPAPRDASDPSATPGSDPERFIPDQLAGGLVAAEHLGRYWWAAQFAGGRRVLDAGCGIGYGSNMLAEAEAAEVVGVDIAKPMIEAASPAAAPSVTFRTGDVADLDLDTDSFELVVCFEMHKHVENTEVVLDELARVLTRGGLLVISTPTCDRYVPGDPNHRYGLLPDELRTSLGRRFEHVRLLRQHDWLASGILEDHAFAGSGGASVDGTEVRKLVGDRPGTERWTLALASDAELPASQMPLTLTPTVELRDWMDHFEAQDHILRDQAVELTRLRALDDERRELRWRLEQAEARLARIPNLELAVTAEARKTEQEARRADQLEQRLVGAGEALHDVMSSPSWRVTAPLRRAKRLLKRVLSG
jgi:2-polyprenyl-3-methyl-5-hydroxy-6-metoxy-1,4-benzoquinol methylase